MTPRTFERFALDVLKTAYGRHGVHIMHTPYGHDEGRDAEGVIELDEDLAEELQIRVKLWIEAKHRSDNVGPYAVGRHLFAAFCRDVTKIIFVTNRDFTDGVQKEIREFCCKSSIQFGLVSGTKLLELATRRQAQAEPNPETMPEQPDRPSGKPLAVRATARMAANLRAPAGQVTQEIVGAGKPFFITVDVHITGHGSVDDFSLQDDPTAMPKLRMVRYGRHPIGPFEDGDNLRLRYTAWAETPGVVDIARFSLTADHISRAVDSEGSPKHNMIVERARFKSFAFAAQTKPTNALRRAVEDWLDHPTFEFVVLSAPAGHGKTHLANELRSQWLARGVEEILLDGADIRNEAALISTLFDYVFPLPPDQLGEKQLRPLQGWLRNAGLAAERAGAIARAIVNRDLNGNASSHLLADIVHALIVSVSKDRPCVLAFEDLHRASHGVLEVIRESIMLLQRRGPQCLWLATSRTSSVDAEADRRESWRAAYEALLASARTQMALPPPDDDDAWAFLAASVRGFEKLMAKRVVTQVGRTPFALREALLYMAATGIIEDDDQLGELVLRRPEDLHSRLETEEFKAATAHRLRLLRNTHEKWLGRLLDAAACLGKRFDLAVCCRLAGVSAGTVLSDTLESCRRESVIRQSFTESRAYQFDHDLIRVATLRTMAVADRIEIAEQLLRDEGKALDLRTRTLLTYLAARAGDFIEYAQQYADDRTSHHRYVDALEALTLAIVVADPQAHDADMRRGVAEAFDDAAAEAQLPELEPRMSGRRLVDLVWKTLQAFVPVTSGSSSTEEHLITYAELIARKERDRGRQAALMRRRGGMLLERGVPDEAYDAHRRAEELFESLPADEQELWRTDRQINAVRWAIACRHTNRKVESLQILTAVLAGTREEDFALRADCLADLGALDFYDRPDRCRELWDQARATYRAAGDAPGEVHMVLDLADLDIAEHLDDDAFQRVRTARDTATELSLDNELLRSDVFSAVLALSASDPDVAHAHLRDALERGLARSIGRRLWKCWANLATVAEAKGDLSESYINDERSISTMPLPAIVLGDGLVLERWPDARVAIALGNVALRARTSSVHHALLARQPHVLRAAAERIASAADGLSPSPIVSRLSGYLRDVCGHVRFLAT